MAFFRLRLGITIGEFEADQFPLHASRFLDRDRAHANKIRLLARDRPGHIGFMRIGQPVGILADNDMPFFQTEETLSFYAERPDAGALAGLDQHVPESFALARWHM